MSEIEDEFGETIAPKQLNTNGPNIMITGTPGVGKSALSERVCAATGLQWVNIGKLADELGCYEGFDPKYGCHVLDEDMVVDALDPQLILGGNVVDYHGSDFFPKRWFDIVFVLRTDTKVLYERLEARGYTGKKLDDNIQCEIFQMMLDEAKNAYDESIVHELRSDTAQDMDRNTRQIVDWVKQWRVDNADKLAPAVLHPG